MVNAAKPPAPRRKYRWYDRPGLTPKQERAFNAIGVALVVLFAIAWIVAIVDARARASATPILSGGVARSPLSPQSPPATPFLLDAAVRRLTASRMRGYSGEVNIHVQAPGDTVSLADSLPADVRVEYDEPSVPGGAVAQPPAPGVWNLLVRMGNSIRQVPNLFVIRLVPLSEKRGGRIGSYVIGNWPYERGGRPRTPAYAPPAGLVRVTPQNRNTPVSEHFTLGDFLTKGQEDVWPKYVAISPRLLDKLELTIQELERSGHRVGDVGVISGFRTPTYNVSGGSTGGRGALSRHMYGDAMDIYIDDNRDGRMDDLNRDGRIDIKDARVLAGAAERVERRYPSLIGGIGVYNPRPGAHGGFVHIDTRGYRARW